MRVIKYSHFSSARSKFVAMSLLFCSMLGSRVLILGTMKLGGMIMSEPNAKENGVSPVAHRLVVRYAHKHLRSSFGHFSFLSEIDFLSQSRIILLDASTCSSP
ncbi:hypothetical protein PS1_037851 [Malus domestica]